MTVITNVENLLHGGRCLVGYYDQGEYVAGWPEVARESIRAINHLTGHGPIPAPTLYRVLGELKGVGHLLPQALAQMTQGLQKSLEVYRVYDARDPADSVLEATLLLNQALRKAAEFGELLEAAQAAISEQGYHDEDDGDPTLFDEEDDSR